MYVSLTVSMAATGTSQEITIVLIYMWAMRRYRFPVRRTPRKHKPNARFFYLLIDLRGTLIYYIGYPLSPNPQASRSKPPGRSVLDVSNCVDIKQ